MSDQPKSKGRGCFFYGCIITLVLFVVVVVGGFLTGRYVVRKMIATYTDAAPMQLPTVQMPPGELEALQKRLDTFRDAVKAGKVVPPLTLSSDEINALIKHSAGELRGRFYVTLEGDQIKGQISIPLDAVGIGMLRGRYLNGAGVFRVSLENGALSVHAQSIEVKGRPVPEQVMAELRKQNLAEDAARDEKTAAAIQKLESIQVQDGKITVTGSAPQ